LAEFNEEAKKFAELKEGGQKERWIGGGT